MLITNKQSLTALKAALLFFHVAELRDLCVQLSLPKAGTKLSLISRIVYFCETGQIVTELLIPAISRAKRGVLYPLKPDTLMLKGAYKNDLKTRLFFKQLIGEYFHFTAFGIDWLHQRWLNGNPPTYQEFADMWQAEYDRRKKYGSTPKEEWAYINFSQQFFKHHPDATREMLYEAWEYERIRNKKIALAIVSAVSCR
ncbi:SAP domain-containing protein [bacterium]|nr:MAG: SAP domain-containing protein [bacterium]